MRAAVIALVALLVEGCTSRCGDYRFTLPATDAFYDGEGQSELKHPKTAFEECGDYGTQGNWTLGVISFEPAGGRSSATFADMLLSVTFSTSEATRGATLTGRERLTGRAFTGLGLTTRDDASLLESSTLSFHEVGEVMVEEVFDRRVIDVSWDLVWEGSTGARYEAKGRDRMDMYLDK
ncbi:MAG: hypothetical protein JNM17_10865 [Archangium sp.]|nr:hypothetical protein [Archangium sp.]